MNQTPGMFVELLTKTLNNLLTEKFVGQPINNVTLHQIKQEIKDLLTTTFNKSKTNLSPISIEWLTTTYFKSAFISAGSAGNTYISEQIVSNDHQPSDLPLVDVRIISTLFHDTDVGDIMSEELNKRKLLS